MESQPQPRGSNREIALPPKFSKTFLVVRQNTSYNYFVPIRQYQLIATLWRVIAGGEK